MRYLIVLCWLLCIVSCENPFAEYEDKSEDLPSGESSEHGDTLIAMNDTARFYLSDVEYSDIQLALYPTPQNLIKNTRYRMPRKLEVSCVLKNVNIPNGYWKSKRRILCYDNPQDDEIKVGSTLFGTGDYYTYIPHGSITKAGQKTIYCIIPIRTERLEKQEGNFNINLNDEWE